MGAFIGLDASHRLGCGERPAWRFIAPDVMAVVPAARLARHAGTCLFTEAEAVGRPLLVSPASRLMTSGLPPGPISAWPGAMPPGMPVVGLTPKGTPGPRPSPGLPGAPGGP